MAEAGEMRLGRSSRAYGGEREFSDFFSNGEWGGLSRRLVALEEVD